MLDFCALPDDLPWAQPAYLLLDGVSLPQITVQLRQFNAYGYCLYLNTRWHELADISPHLVPLTGAHDPLLAHFEKYAAQEWGYLLFSDAKVQTLCEHWRSLLTVEHPSGVHVMPRFADPAVMHPLFALSEHAGSARWFGPVSHLCLPDGVENRWHQHTRPASATAQTPPYRITDQELTAFEEVEFRRFVSDLNEHLHTYFADFMATFAHANRRPYAKQIANAAYQKGFATEQEITLFANVFGYLAGEPLSDHPEIAQLLTASSCEAPLKRLERAATLAEQRATDRKGRPS